jgi:hypothetical protein
MPFKNREKYLEYQRSYYKKRKRNPGSTQGSNREDISNLGLTAGLSKKMLNPKSSVQFPSKKQGVTSTLNRSIPKPSIPPSRSFPVNPVKPARNRVPEEHVGRLPGNALNRPTLMSSDNIWGNTRTHVEKLKKDGWEVDDVGNARRVITDQNY